MQRLGGLWLPHVPPLKKTSFFIQFRAQYSIHRRRRRRRPVQLSEREAPLRENFKTFEASPLILDLDAENNKYVRPYDPQVDGVPSDTLRFGLHRSPSVEKRIEQFEKQSQEYRELFSATAANKFSPWRISNYDILSYALDPPAQITNRSNHSDSQNMSLRTVLTMNGVPYNLQDNPSEVIKYMLHRQRRSHQVIRWIDDARLLEDELLYFQRRKFGKPDFTRLQRLITSIIQTPDGCQLVSQCTGKVANICAEVAKTTTPAHMLSFLNNLIMTLESQDLPISNGLLVHTYLLSIQCYAFTTAQKYLIMFHKHARLHGHQVIAALRLLERSIAPAEPERTMYRNEADTTHQLLAIYCLLVGRELQKRPKPALRSHAPKLNDPRFKDYYKIYVTCLARLGAFRTLWYVWHMNFGLTEINTTSGTKKNTLEPDLVDIELKATTFRTAIQEATRTNSRIGELAQSSRFAFAAAELEVDCQLDMGTITMSAGAISTRDQDQDYQVDKEEIRRIFEETDIKEAMAALKRLLQQIPTNNVEDEPFFPYEFDDVDTEHDRSE
ncbi:hypothetical protein F5Y04DRAFT_251707 [Hypomontagnella monticulosa]|nr:hypothetical protein F5Y04DRAFT_251707 [Hypomontagnella monticulosa]